MYGAHHGGHQTTIVPLTLSKTAKPIADSVAATVMITIAKICPVKTSIITENKKEIASNINSIDITIKLLTMPNFLI